MKLSKLYGLLGEKLKHSFSPQIHEIIFNNTEISGHYHLFEVDKNELDIAVRGLRAIKMKGVNVTIPYKVEVMKYLDNISPEAEKIGAVNTISFKDKNTIGYNTDYFGFGTMLQTNNINIKDRKVVVLGTGGASKAVVQYLIDNNAKEVVLVSRSVKKARDKFSNYKIITYNKIKELSSFDTIINCTPCGMYPDVNNSPINASEFDNFEIAIDIIYNPIETKFLYNAKQRGLKTVNGLYMLVGQAVKAQEIWNNINIDKKIIESIYKKLLYFQGDKSGKQ